MEKESGFHGPGSIRESRGVLLEWIFSRIIDSARKIEKEIAHSKHPAGGEQCFTGMFKGDRRMMRKALFKEDMSVEASHFLYGKYPIEPNDFGFTLSTSPFAT